MEEKEFNEKRDKYGLVCSEQYKKIRERQINMILGYARADYDEKELKGMLKLIAKTDEWKDDFIKIQNKRNK